MSLEIFANLAPGSVSVFAGDSTRVRQEITDLGRKINGRAFALLEVPSTIRSARLGPHLADQLADIALALWPFWYEAVLEVPRDSSSAVALSALDTTVAEAASRHRGVNLGWVRHAARMAHEGRPPVIAEMSATLQLVQLEKVISTTGLVLLLDGTWSESPDADALARQLENAARASGLSLVLISGNQLPEAFARFTRLAEDPAPIVALPRAVGLEFGPVVGRPHPGSQAEQRLYERIANTEDLCALFSWNQVLELSPAATPKVDLVWPEGKLVVEIDGWLDHSTREKFESDRLRDYALLAAGYVVFRVSNTEVLNDTERVVAKLRELVRVQSQKRK